MAQTTPGRGRRTLVAEGFVEWLALRGWPLIRSAEKWEREHHNDFGFPEALAYKVVIWEAWAKARQFVVPSVRGADRGYVAEGQADVLEIGPLGLPGGPATTSMLGRAHRRNSPGLERRVRAGQHVGGQVGRHELAIDIDDSEALEPCTSGIDARRR
jgi:hypothetical protein